MPGAAVVDLDAPAALSGGPVATSIGGVPARRRRGRATHGLLRVRQDVDEHRAQPLARRSRSAPLPAAASSVTGTSSGSACAACAASRQISTRSAGASSNANRPREVEHAGDDAVEPRDFLVDARRDVSTTSGDECLPQTAHRGLDDHQRVADLVRDDRREPAERRQPLALRGLALEPVERGSVSCRNVVASSARVLVVPRAAGGHRRGPGRRSRPSRASSP